MAAGFYLSNTRHYFYPAYLRYEWNILAEIIIKDLPLWMKRKCLCYTSKLNKNKYE